MDLTQEIVREFYDYDPETGIFTHRSREEKWFPSKLYWTKWNREFAGKVALTNRDKEGYLRGRILGKHRFAHRIAFLWMTGEFPDQVDHLNRDPSDNRWSNLRAANNYLNKRNRSLRRNNTSGVNGVTQEKSTGKWVASIADRGRHISLGRFTDKEEAVRARAEANAQYGYHPTHGRTPEHKP